MEQVSYFPEQTSKFKVLLYSDGSNHSLSAAVYAATLMKIMPGMELTIIYVQEKHEGSTGIESTGWYIYDPEAEKQTREILQKTNEIFTSRGYQVNQKIRYGSTTVSDIANAIIDYAVDNDCKLIIMGARGPIDFKSLIFGGLSQTVFNRSSIPVLLIKKLPREFLDNL